MDDIIDIDIMDYNNGNSSHGGGLELLMNEKVKESRYFNTSGLDDITNVDNEFNDLSSRNHVNNNNDNDYLFSKPRSELFNHTTFEDNSNNGNMGIHFKDEPYINSSPQFEENNTWDGYSKLGGQVPINPDNAYTNTPKLSRDDQYREKLKFLKFFLNFEKKGGELTKTYNIDSSLEEMRAEFEIVKSDEAKRDSVLFYSETLRSAIHGLEYLNKSFNPFDIHLEGLGQKIEEDSEIYDSIFGELYEKYKNRGSIAPEIKLLFRIAFSAMLIHGTQKIFKNMTGGLDINVDNILKQNPILAEGMQNALINELTRGKPGMGEFMNLMTSQSNVNDNNSSTMSREPRIPVGTGPPPPIYTQGVNAVLPPTYRPGNNTTYAQSAYSVPNQPQKGPLIRSEMKGPNINEYATLLSGIKTKQIDIQETNNNNNNNNSNNNSKISLDEARELNNNLPTRSKRRPRNTGNTVSL